jgi:quercetin dioxygenase-like cupin family protein
VKVRFDKDQFRWEGIEQRPYKEGEGFEGIVRYALADQLPAAFQLRYFELEPGGYSNLEKHGHVHFVVALRGVGKALVGEDVVELEPFDAVYVPQLTPHRWLNHGSEPFGFLCPVDSERDRPQRLEKAELEMLRANPLTAPYAF